MGDVQAVLDINIPASTGQMAETTAMDFTLREYKDWVSKLWKLLRNKKKKEFKAIVLLVSMRSSQHSKDWVSK